VIARDIYEKETGKDIQDDRNAYYIWLKETVEELYEPSIISRVKLLFDHAEQKQWYETYWAIDIHGTITIPDYRKVAKVVEYYPYAKETLQPYISDKPNPDYFKAYPDQVSKYGVKEELSKI